MKLALYREERPEIFDDIIGQKQIVKILKNQIKTGTVSQAYLFAGTHGTGKTTTARILAKAVNCLSGEVGTDADLPCGKCENCEAIREGKFVDVIELDAASNNGVEDLRSIIDLVKYPPSIGKYKVYIIDEVHMLTQAAENAFLKTLEEPPEYAIFILATTDPQKVRATIRSRCMELNFKRVSEDELIQGMQRICDKKNVKTTADALATIASKADGSVRDALSILEQCMAAGDEELSKNLVLEYTGSAGEDFYLALTETIAKKDLGKALIYIDEIIKRGKDAKQILKDWLEHYRNLMIVKYVGKADRIINLSTENIERIKAQAKDIDIRAIESAIRLLSEYINLGRYSDRPRILLETAAVKLVGDSPLINVAEKSDQESSVSVKKEKESVPEKVDEKVVKNTEPDNLNASLEAGNAEDMWNNIVKGMSSIDVSFEGLVGNNSIGSEYSNGELVINIKKNKQGLAENKISDIKSVAERLYGNVKLVFVGVDDINKNTNAENQEDSNAEVDINEIAESASELFGIKVDIKES